MYYFTFGYFDGANFVAIIEKSTWDNDHSWSKPDELDEILPSYLQEVMECTFEFEEVSIERVRQDLLSLGFEENPEIGHDL